MIHINYHNITHDDMNNGDGLRVVLWLSGCSHHCFNCQNPQTWDPDSGIPFDELAKQEIFNELSKNYISGITLSGGDPLHENNLSEVLSLTQFISKQNNLALYRIHMGRNQKCFWKIKRVVTVKMERFSN